MSAKREELNKQKILNSAKDLFWKYGLKKVSVNDICKKSNISKMTFYKFFPNKIEIAKKILDDLFEDGLIKFREIMQSDLPIDKKIEKMFILKKEAASNISKEFLMDFYVDEKLGLKEYIEQKTNDIWNEMISIFKMGQAKGWFRKDIKPEFYLYLMKKSNNLFIDDELISLYQSPDDLVMEVTKFLVYGIVQR